jgi:hypothetical protein
MAACDLPGYFFKLGVGQQGPIVAAFGSANQATASILLPRAASWPPKIKGLMIDQSGGEGRKESKESFYCPLEARSR